VLKGRTEHNEKVTVLFANVRIRDKDLQPSVVFLKWNAATRQDGQESVA
jgi:hypothetical protein